MDPPRTLVLIPTELERSQLPALPALPGCREAGRHWIRLCGFGPIAAAARTAQLITIDPPERVLLIGIAGSLNNRIPVGSAACFAQVICYGVGAGSGDDFQSAGEMGWQQWTGEQMAGRFPAGRFPAGRFPAGRFPAGRFPAGQRPAGWQSPIGDSLDLFQPFKTETSSADLLTCCAASASPAESLRRAERYPEAVAEDMEGYGVAMACRLAGVPLTIVRGISNVAGDRAIDQWKTAEALESAAALAAEILRHQPSST